MIRWESQVDGCAQDLRRACQAPGLSMCLCMCLCLFLCVCLRERERERGCVCSCERACARMCECVECVPVCDRYRWCPCSRAYVARGLMADTWSMTGRLWNMSVMKMSTADTCACMYQCGHVLNHTGLLLNLTGLLLCLSPDFRARTSFPEAP